MANKESILKQISVVQYNLSRFSTLVQTDLADMPDKNVGFYCLQNIFNQTKNIIKEFTGSTDAHVFQMLELPPVEKQSKDSTDKLNFWSEIEKYSPALLDKYAAYKNKTTGIWELEEDELLELLHEIVCDVKVSKMVEAKPAEHSKETWLGIARQIESDLKGGMPVLNLASFLERQFEILGQTKVVTGNLAWADKDQSKVKFVPDEDGNANIYYPGIVPFFTGQPHYDAEPLPENYTDDEPPKYETAKDLDAPFNPNWRSHPLETIIREAIIKQVSFTELAIMLDMESPVRLANFLMGKTKINEQISEGLQKILGGSKQFWLNRQADYDAPIETKDGYDPISCDHKTPNGFSAFRLLKGGGGSGPNWQQESSVSTCMKCGDINVSASYNVKYLEKKFTNRLKDFIKRMLDKHKILDAMQAKSKSNSHYEEWLDKFLKSLADFDMMVHFSETFDVSHPDHVAAIVKQCNYMCREDEGFVPFIRVVTMEEAAKWWKGLKVYQRAKISSKYFNKRNITDTEILIAYKKEH